MTTTLSHKEMTSHIRNRIAKSGIKARVMMESACGSNYVKVVVPTYEARFTAEEIYQIALIAKTNRLTGVRGTEINPEHEALLVGKQQWNFYL